MRKRRLLFLLVLLCLFPLIEGHSQTTIRGVVLDQEGGETVIGAQVRIPGTGSGTISDFTGSFSLETTSEFPLILTVESAGFEPLATKLNSPPDTELVLILTPVIDMLNEVVISASRVEESLLSSPSGIDKINLVEWQTLPGADPFASLALAKGMQLNTGSFGFPSLNTRGFSDMQNWRFLQFVDGMELTSPGLGYSLGNNSGPGNLDVRSVELVPGPGSALYGPNAFNGILSLSTKDPFTYPGISAHIQGGLTHQPGLSPNPFTEVAVRFAKPVNSKFGYKINLGYSRFTDWEVNDQSFHITPTRIPLADQLLQTPANSPVFDAVSRFGDEIQIPLTLAPDSVILVNRTGIAERDIVDYDSDRIKLGGSLYYNLDDQIRATYDVRYFQGDAILRHTTVYPLRNIAHLMQKFEIRGDNFYLRAYHSQEDANDSYAILGTGAFIQEGLKSSQDWAQDYAFALSGVIPGIAAGDHQQARDFADRDIPGPESEAFQALRNATLENPDILSGGSQFIDKSGFIHIEGMYDFGKSIKLFDLQEGISYRRYFLNSEGNLFNDGPLGFNGIIPVEEYGAFAQASKSWLDERLVFRGSLRFDKNQNFEGRVSPRGALVFSPDRAKQHFFRVSAQTGFRNPSPQESYIALDIGDVVILGGTQDNIDQYRYSLADGNLINGRDIHQTLMTLTSVQTFLAGGGTDPSVLQPLRLDFLSQEQITTYEAGYRGIIDGALFLELSGYYNRYQDFVTRSLGYSLEAGRAFAVYSNVETPITSLGGEVLVEYRTRSGYRLKGTYTYTEFDADEAIQDVPSFLPGFNAPRHRATAWLSNQDIVGGIGFSVALRWSDEYVWQSPFGEGIIDAYTVVDGYLSYRMEEVKSVIKLGASNLLNTPYQTMYGGPMIGAQYYFSLTFDEMFR